jgi:fibronectin type 3 domain-containing protein
MCLASFSLAAEYTFQWDANHPNDNVVAYRIYWSKSSGDYNTADREYISVGSLSDPDNPHWTINIPDLNAGEDYYFVCTAVDNKGYESDDSAELSTNPEAIDTTPPTITWGPTTGDIETDSARISWGTDEVSDSEVITIGLIIEMVKPQFSGVTITHADRLTGRV